MTTDSFRAERTRRTRQYTGGLTPTVPAGILATPDIVESAAGQVAVLTATNLLARSHPAVFLSAPDAQLVIASPRGGSTLHEACDRIVRGVDPDLTFRATRVIPADVPTMGLGAQSERATVYCGGQRWTAILARNPVDTSVDQSSLLGLGLAVTMASGTLFRLSLGLEGFREGSASLWSLGQPGSDLTGPPQAGPIDVGTTWLVGVGAVGSCLAWWLHVLGIEGSWTAIDGDDVKALNLDRSLGFFADQTPEMGSGPMKKSDAVATLHPRIASFPGWWHEWVAQDPHSPDVLVLDANEYGVRSAVAAYSHPAVITATTSRNWTGELHRHLLLRDGCVACRFPAAAPIFECATAPVVVHAPGDSGSETQDVAESTDASLPFLSATAGLLQVAALLQLQHGEWARHEHNHWEVGFDPAGSLVQSHNWPHWASCRTVASPDVRTRLHSGTRWHQLDPDSHGSPP